MSRSFRANDCSHIWAESDYIELNAAIEYWCEGDARCRLAKEQAILSACERGLIQWERADKKPFNDPIRELAARNLVLIERKSFDEWAKVVDERIELPQPMSSKEANSLRRQVGALSLLLAKRDRRYRNDELGNPSAKAIADDLLEMLDAFDQDRAKTGEGTLNRAGISSSNLRQCISDGLKQLRD